MKYYEIIIFVLCLHVSVALVNATGIFHTTQEHDKEWFNQLYLSAEDEYEPGNVESDGWIASLIESVKALAMFIINFAVGIIVVPTTLGAFGLGSPYVYYISVLIYAIYIIALIQIISNRGFKGMS